VASECFERHRRSFLNRATIARCLSNSAYHMLSALHLSTKEWDDPNFQADDLIQQFEIPYQNDEPCLLCQCITKSQRKTTFQLSKIHEGAFLVHGHIQQETRDLSNIRAKSTQDTASHTVTRALSCTRSHCPLRNISDRFLTN
jgi:hypothetical protein